MAHFYLDDDENFDITFGEIILTTKGKLAFYCNLCGEYKTFETFMNHLLERCSPILDDDFKLCIKESTPMLNKYQNLKTEPSESETNILEEVNLNSPKHLELEDLNKVNNVSPSFEIEYFDNFEDSILSESEQQHSRNSHIEIDPKMDTCNSETKSFDLDPVEIEYCNENIEEIVNIEHLEDAYESTHTEDEHGENEHEIADRETELENIHEKNMQDIKHKNRQPEQNKQNQEKQNSKKRKESNEVDIPVVVRQVRKKNLYGPSKVSDEERKYKCPVCNLGFKDRHNMNHHLKRHTDQKNFSCPKCGKKFFSSTEVRLHLKSHGIVEKSFLCNECGLGFDANYKLLNHQKRHTNQRDYICKICSKGFYSLNTLKDHMSCHTSDRPFSCKACGATFKRRNGLLEHRKMHANERKYKCKICDAAYNVHAGLFSHMKSKHKDMTTFNE